MRLRATGPTTRRQWFAIALRLVAGGALIERFAPSSRAGRIPESSSGTPLDKLLSDHAVNSSLAAHCRYRAHAYVRLFAFPIFSRQDVGGGYAVVERGACGDAEVIGLQFAGGSSGERTHGLNRVGLIQEAAIGRGGAVAKSAYFGFMISSGEKSLDQGRKSLQTATEGTLAYSAASGLGGAGEFRCTSNHVSVPARFNWSNFEQLTHEMRGLLASSRDTEHYDVPLRGSGDRPDTFLYSIRRAILSSEPRRVNLIVYNGKRYQLATAKQPDKRMGAQLAARGLVRQAETVWRLNGSTIEMQGKQASAFEIWFEQNTTSGLPVRIEFYPKSFLKLVFERQNGDGSPNFSYLLNGKPSVLAASSAAR